jgi:hypothetical protein
MFTWPDDRVTTYSEPFDVPITQLPGYKTAKTDAYLPECIKKLTL